MAGPEMAGPEMDRSGKTLLLFMVDEIILAKLMKTSERDRSRPVARRSARPWITFLLAALLAAAGAVRAEAGSTAAQVSFTDGVIAFDEGDAAAAARLFAEAAGNDPDEGTFLHWLGLAELRLGRAAEAAAHLEQSLRARRPPAAGRARVKDDLRLARAAAATAASGKAAAAAITAVTAPDYRPEALRFADLPRWEGRIALASGWDSNPELVTEERPFALPGEKVPGGVPSDAAAYLDAETGFHPFYDRRGWSLGLDLSGHRSTYRQERDLDLTLVEGTASLGWGGDPRGTLEGPLGALPVPAGQGRLALLLQAGGSRAWLAGDLYRGTVDGAASLFVRETPATTTRIGASWSDRDFFPAGLALLRPSGKELAGSVDQWITLGRPDRSLRLGAAAGRYDADRVFERTFREVSAEAAVPLAPRWTLYLTGEVHTDDYANRESNLALPDDPLAPPRRDTTRRASATAVWRATDRLSWSLRASEARRRSNVEIPFGGPLLDFDRTVVSLGAAWLF